MPLNTFFLVSLLVVPFETGSPRHAFSPVPAAGRTCKSVSTCEEAVELWCGGYRRADADADGIPCENVCHSLQNVEEIRKAIGC